MSCIGDHVWIVNGVFAGLEGVVEANDAACGKVSVRLLVFGKELSLPISFSDVETDRRKVPRRLGEIHLPRFLQGLDGIVESYLAEWHGRGCFQERLTARVNRYADHAEIVGIVFARNDDADWYPLETSTRVLGENEWAEARALIAETGFWELTTNATATPCVDGDVWMIEGCREGCYHSVHRHTGHCADGVSGAEMYRLGKQLARLAGLRRFDQD